MSIIDINDNNMANLVDKALLYYDTKMIYNNKFINIENIKVDREKTTIIFKDISDDILNMKY